MSKKATTAGISGLSSVVKKLRIIAWDWSKSGMEQVVSELGLAERTTGSETWIGFRSPVPDFPEPDPEFPGNLLDHPYGFSFRGQELVQFQLCLAAVDMGDVCLFQSDRYTEICEQRHAEYQANFKKAVKQITAILGKPNFQGTPDDEGSMAAHPVGWGGELTAVWPLTNARLILVYGQEDKELPIVLDLYVCTPKDEM